jgi:hypothetical protein
MGRKESLPLEDGRNASSRVPVAVLHKRANQPGTIESKIINQHKDAHSAWKSMPFSPFHSSIDQRRNNSADNVDFRC